MKVLFNALPFQRGTDPATVLLAYTEALRGSTTEAVASGISKFLRGECSDVNPRYVPTPPELARIVRSAVVPSRVPVDRRIAPFRHRDDGERARMRLKMPLYQFASTNGRMDELARANSEGLDAMVALASRWDIPIPDELAGMTNQEWISARNRSWAEIERNPPPFMRGTTKARVA